MEKVSGRKVLCVILMVAVYLISLVSSLILFVSGSKILTFVVASVVFAATLVIFLILRDGEAAMAVIAGMTQWFTVVVACIGGGMIFTVVAFVFGIFILYTVGMNYLDGRIWYRQDLSCGKRGLFIAKKMEPRDASLVATPEILLRKIGN